MEEQLEMFGGVCVLCSVLLVAGRYASANLFGNRGRR